MSASIVAPARRRAPREARTDIRASSARRVVGEAVGGAHRGVLRGQPGAEQQRVVGAERDLRAGVEQLAQRHRGQVAVDAERDVRDRAHLQRHARPRRPGRAAPGPRRPGRRARSGRRAASSRQVRTLSGPSSSPPCGASSRPARSAIANAGAKSAVVPRRSSLDSPKPTTPRPAYCAASRASVRASSGCRVRLAAITTAMPRPVGARRLAHGVEDQVGEGGDPAEPGGVPARVDLDLQPAAAVGDVVLGRLAHQPAHVVLGAQHRPGDVVEPLEAEPALLVGGRQLRRPVLDQRVGQQDPVALGQLDQGRVPHRPGEVQVQVRLGQRQQVPSASLRRVVQPGSAEQLLDPADALGQVVVAERVGQPQVAGRAERLARAPPPPRPRRG